MLIHDRTKSMMHGVPWPGPWLALGLAMAGPWPGPWLVQFRPFPVQTSSSSDQFRFRPVLVQTGSVQVVPVRFAAILNIGSKAARPSTCLLFFLVFVCLYGETLLFFLRSFCVLKTKNKKRKKRTFKNIYKNKM